MPTEEELNEADELAPLSRLIALQEEDEQAAQLTYRRAHLPERAALEELTKARLAFQLERSALASRHAELAAEQDRLEGEIGEVRKRIAAIEARLRGGTVASFRDQEAMATESGSLLRRQRDFEDAELEVMEGLEPLDAELARLDGLIAERTDEIASAERLLAEAEVAVDELLAGSRSRRGPLVAAVPPALLADYERLAAHLGGVGAARVVHNACSGCHLSLSSTEADRIRHSSAETVFHCEQCGRILVP